MPVRDIAVEVLGVTDSVLKLRIGDTTVDMPKELLAKYMDYSLHDPTDTVIRNIAMRLALSGVRLEDGVNVKKQIDKVNFKILGE